MSQDNSADAPVPDVPPKAAPDTVTLRAQPRSVTRLTAHAHRAFWRFGGRWSPRLVVEYIGAVLFAQERTDVTQYRSLSKTIFPLCFAYKG
ncbi:hypothetical protein SAMN05216198_1425 [Halopseudomonas litoralis]|uniref:Uncharacterized protein n=1 Tax=Halopseudomonas litoralis TaxID=797277 RepID=A0A1H1QAK1_9GAMM|nr:hypothetical protein [Halopseudomonas litoralis]SDS20333.1 hypothetical protein SAMN05216198_1425 [Halopseudomonas litoralis]